MLDKCSFTASTAIMTPFLISTGFAPWVTLSKPAWAIARAKTVAVVVPSPAFSFVLLATSWTSFAPIFWNLSCNSIALATVTPSLVIFGLPQEDSIMTFLPLGPIVTATASAKISTPLSISFLTSAPNLTSFAICRELAPCKLAAALRASPENRYIINKSFYVFSYYKIL